ncbi:MAG TPA: hypothetical protein VF765_37110 [Polyangiaceae bacterium]
MRVRVDTGPLPLGGLIFVASCAATRPPADPSDGDSADPCDVCVLQRSDDLTGDDDGCPEPDLRMTDACSLSSAQEALLARTASELSPNAHLTSVRVVSGVVACASAVRTALERHGLPSVRLEVASRGSEPSVNLEVGAWDGKRCEESRRDSPSARVVSSLESRPAVANGRTSGHDPTR